MSIKTKTRSHTKQEISSTIFDNPDMLRIIAENSQTPNIRAVNKNAALIGQSNMDKLGKKHGSFQEKVDFISNNELYANLPLPRHRRNDVINDVSFQLETELTYRTHRQLC